MMWRLFLISGLLLISVLGLMSRSDAAPSDAAEVLDRLRKEISHLSAVSAKELKQVRDSIHAFDERLKRVENALAAKQSFDLVEIVLRDWVPPLIFAAFAGLLIAKFQHRYAQIKSLTEKKIDAWINTGKNSTQYLNQLVRVQKLEEEINTLQVSPGDKPRLAQLETERAQLVAHNSEIFAELLGNLLFSQYFFRNEDVHKAIKDFQTWYHEVWKSDEKIELRPDSPAMLKRNAILKAMGDELTHSGGWFKWLG